MRMTQLPISGRHTQTNGLVEHYHVIKTYSMSKKGWDWDKISMSEGVLFAYRSTPHQSTGMSPFICHMAMTLSYQLLWIVRYQ